MSAVASEALAGFSLSKYSHPIMRQKILLFNPLLGGTRSLQESFSHHVHPQEPLFSLEVSL